MWRPSGRLHNGFEVVQRQVPVVGGRAIDAASGHAGLSRGSCQRRRAQKGSVEGVSGAVAGPDEGIQAHETGTGAWAGWRCS
jgi:hypothetical protein